VNSLTDYFHTNWAAMTVADWAGLIVTIVIFLLMVGLYVGVFRPENKERFEAQRHIPFHDDRFDAEDNNDR